MKGRLISLLRKQRLRFAGGLLLGAATIIAGIGLMSSSGYLITRAAERPMIVDLFMVTAAVRFFGISRAVVRYFERLVSHDLVFRILVTVRAMVYRKLDAAPLKWIMGRRPGDLLARLVTDIETLQSFYLRIISPSVVAAVISIITCSALFFFDAALAGATLFFLLISGLVAPWLAVNLARGRGKKDIITRAEIKVFLVDRIQGMQDLLLLGQKKRSEKEFASMQNKLDDLQSANAGTTGLLEGLNIIFSNMAMFTSLVIAIPLVISGEIEGVMLAALTLGVLSSFESVQYLAAAYLHLETSGEAAGRLFSITDRDGEEVTSGSDIPEGPRNICFRNVAFSYLEEHIAVEDINFSLEMCSATAIAGPSGSGKSTLVNLLLRFWEPDKGCILFGDKDIRMFDPDLYRSLFMVVSQDEFIFNRSLRENLLIAKPDADDDELVQCLEKAGLGSFAANLDMQAGDRGMRLSGGERQLFALARALLKDSPVWIMDEPTAHMDANTERRVLDTIWSAAGNRTLLLITHRLVDMDRMDRIIVIDKGRITGSGTHSGLLRNNPLYAGMFRLQSQVIEGL